MAPKKLIDILKEDYTNKFISGKYPDRKSYEDWKIISGTDTVVKRSEPPETTYPTELSEAFIYKLMQDCYEEGGDGVKFTLAVCHTLLAKLEVTYDGNFNIRIKP